MRLDELREQAVDLRFELRLVDHEPASLVSELRSALDRCPSPRTPGRDAGARAVPGGTPVRSARGDLPDAHDAPRTLGLAPSPALSELEMRILRQDPDLLTHRPRARRPSVGRTDARLRAAVALIRIGVYEEALTIVDATIAKARADGDQRTLALALLAQAQALSLSGGGDPHALIDQAQAIARARGDGQLLAQGGARPGRQRGTRRQDGGARRADRAAGAAGRRRDRAGRPAVRGRGDRDVHRRLAGGRAPPRRGSAGQRIDSRRCAARPSGWPLGASSPRCTAQTPDGARDGDRSRTRSPAAPATDGDSGRDPGVAARRVHGSATSRRRRTAPCAGTGAGDSALAFRRDQSVAVQDDERDGTGRARSRSSR